LIMYCALLIVVHFCVSRKRMFFSLVVLFQTSAMQQVFYKTLLPNILHLFVVCGHKTSSSSFRRVITECEYIYYTIIAV
jgi:hypothetical protein